MSLWGELRRRNIFRVAAAYLVLSWLLIQVADTIAPMMNLSDAAPRFVLFLLIVLFPVVLFLAWVFEITPDGIKQTSSVSSSESVTQVTGRKLNYIVIGLLALAVAYMFVDNYMLESGRREADVEQATLVEPPATVSPSPAIEAEPFAALPNSVAVLPLDNLSPDPDNAYFAAGMHEEILNHLAKLKNLNVISRTSVLRYAQNRPPLPVIARELNVEAVIEGSVRFDGENVLVTAQLIDATTDSHLWSERYERELAGVFAIQADIAMNVANALEAEFSEEEQERIERPPTDDPLAYALYLQIFRSNLPGIDGGGERMLELLEQATEIDPEFALAYGQKAGVYASRLINTTAISARGERAALESLARENIAKALELDPETVTALLALGNLASISWRWTEAEQAYRRALEIDESSGGGGSLWFWSWSGNEAEALRLAERHVALSPLEFVTHWWHGVVLTYAGDYDEAVAKFRDGIELLPVLPLQHSWLALAEIARGNIDEAARELALNEQLLGDNRAVISLLDLCYGYGRIGDRDNALRIFDDIMALVDDGQDIGTGGWALVSLAIGNLDEALEWLERGVEAANRHEPDAGYYSLMNIKMNFTNDPVLERPEFVDVRNRLRGD